MFDLREAFAWITDGVLYGNPSTPVAGVATDSRSVPPHSLFVALRGERFDGHDFITTAQASGAAAVLLERWVEGARRPVIRVPDTRRALGEIARGWRSCVRTPIVTITGANGKTTVKEMLAAILAEAFGADRRLATRGNLNNEIGVPLTLLQLRAAHRAAAIELGTNHPGEIAWLASLARPDVALVTNAQREHQEFLAGAEGSARENGASITALGADGIAVFPGDDPQAHIWRAGAGARRCIEFGLAAEPGRFEVHAAEDALAARFALAIGNSVFTVRLPVPGQHNVRNALAAAACAHALAIDTEAIRRGLESFSPPPGRLATALLADGTTLIDDSYNANPDSVLAAVEVLAGFAGRRVLVLGDMGETGEQGPDFHREIGAHARARGIDHLHALGPASREAVAAFGAAATHHDDVDGLIAACCSLRGPDTTILVKGSRFMRMERVVQALSGASVDA